MSTTCVNLYQSHDLHLKIEAEAYFTVQYVMPKGMNRVFMFGEFTTQRFQQSTAKF